MKNACIVGYGAIGPIHAAALNKCCDAVFYAVCDISESKLKQCSESYPEVKTYSDLDTMLSDNAIDVIHICTPHYLHKEMLIKALKANKDVVIEKPVTLNIDELKELYDIKTDKKICVMLQNRSNNCVKTLKNIIENDKTVGKLIGSSAFLTWQRTPEYYKSDEWRGKWKTEGGGLLINQAIHTIDLIDYLGSGCKSVKASISTKALDDVIEVEDTADVLFKMNDGTVSTFYGTNAYGANVPPRIELNFENATFRYADERLYKITDTDTVIIDDDSNNAIGKKYWGSGHQTVINSFYSSLLGKGGEYTDLMGAMHAMKLLFAIYESAKNNSKEIII